MFLLPSFPSGFHLRILPQEALTLRFFIELKIRKEKEDNAQSVSWRRDNLVLLPVIWGKNA